MIIDAQAHLAAPGGLYACRALPAGRGAAPPLAGRFPAFPALNKALSRS